MGNDFASALVQTAQRIGIDPVDLGTVISYETGGTFDPWQRGPTTKWGTHRGLIQFGEPQQQKYGVYQGQSATDQLGSVAKYLQDTGVKPGMGLLDVYSAINAGAPGRYNASDTAAGGAPGTVRDKVEQQMGAHRAKAESLLAGQFAPGGSTTSTPGAGQTPMAGTSLAEALPGATLPGGPVAIPVQSAPDPMQVAAANLAQQFQQRDEQQRQEAERRRVALFSPAGGVGGLYG